MNYRTKVLLANIVCIVIVICIWTLFLAPILVLVSSYLRYYSPAFDTSANSTIADVFDSQSCTNHTLEEAIVSIKQVAAGNFSGNFTCSSPYLSNGTQCVPECLLWNPGGELYYYLYRYSVPTLSLITTTVGVFGASTWLFLKRLWKFPHIISLYLLISVIGQSIVIFIGSISPTNFYCTSRNLLESRLNSSMPCHIQGALFQYFLLSFMLWYLCDLFNILYILLLPLKANTFFQHIKKIHLTQAVICWGIPSLIVIAIGAAKSYEIVSVPLFCLPSVYITMFTYFIPGVAFSLLTQTSFAILCTILYKRHIKMSSQTANSEYVERLRQIALFSTAFSVLTVAILVHYTCLGIGYRQFGEYVTDYWHCLTVFDRNNECCKPVHIAHYYPFTGFLSNVAFCTWGIVGVSAVSVKEAKNLWKRGFKRCFDKFHSTSNQWSKEQSLSLEAQDVK